jgi:hypothetical protein
MGAEVLFYVSDDEKGNMVIILEYDSKKDGDRDE